MTVRAIAVTERTLAMKRLLIASVATLVTVAAWADYPEKPVTIVVPFSR